MSSFMDAIRGVNLSSEFRENDEDTICTYDKLQSIIEMFLGQYPSLPKEIRVYPADFIKRRPDEFDELQIYVIPDTAEDIAFDVVSEAQDMFMCLIDGEFPDIKKGATVSFTTHFKKDLPTFVMYAKQREFLYGDESISQLAISICKYVGCPVSVPVPLGDEAKKVLFVHLDEVDKITTLNRYVNQFETFTGSEFACDASRKVSDFYYIPITKASLDATLPYCYIDERWLELEQ